MNMIRVDKEKRTIFSSAGIFPLKMKRKSLRIFGIPLTTLSVNTMGYAGHRLAHIFVLYADLFFLIDPQDLVFHYAYKSPWEYADMQILIQQIWNGSQDVAD